jgi:hypothetical protein
VGLDIQPTFTIGAFTGVNLYAIRAGGTIVPSVGNAYSLGNPSFNFAQVHSRQFLSSGANGFEFYPAFTVKSGQWFSTGNLLIQNGGTFTDAGFRLDVVGADSRFNGIRAGLGAGQVAGNTVFGNGALGSNVSSIGLTAIGFEALKLCTGANNTALGYQAGSSITTGASNMVIGRNALGLTTTGSGNVAIGREALFSNTTGSNNTGLGFGTQSGNFSGSVILGRDATATANNQFVVGSTGTIAGAVSTATAVQTKTWDVIINGVAQKILLA